MKATARADIHHVRSANTKPPEASDRERAMTFAGASSLALFLDCFRRAAVVAKLEKVIIGGPTGGLKPRRCSFCPAGRLASM